MKRFFIRNGKNRYFILCCIVALLLVGIAAQLFRLQVLLADKLSRQAAQQMTADITQNNPRGRIVDRDGEELAVSIMTSSLYVDPQEMREAAGRQRQHPERDFQRMGADLLAPALHMDAEKLYGKFTSEGRFLWVKRTIEPDDAETVKKIIRDNKLPGLHFLEESKRYYTKKRVAAQVLGFVGTDDVGLSGIELVQDAILRGAETRHETLFDALGHQIFGGDRGARQRNRSTVYLTLDSSMQYVLENAMDDAIARTQAAGAAAIIMDPYTGEILGMASRPTFDPNHFADYSPETWNNKGISMIYEPGSVFKPIVASIGLTEGTITPETLIQDNGSIKIADRVIHNWDGEGRGLIPFYEVIKYSVNTGMVQLGMQLGAERLISYSKKFGFGAPTEIELPGEESGILYDASAMYEPDVATMSIGQGIAVTPIQILTAICAIANGGELLQPYIVKKIVAPNGDVISEKKPKPVRRVMSGKVAGQLRAMMEKVVDGGGGKNAAIKGYRIAGKTGTAERIAENGGYAKGKYISSFVGFVPADKPRYAMLVMLDTPQGAFYGSQVAAPIFRDTLQQILVAKGIQPGSSEGLPSFEEITVTGGARPAANGQQLLLLPDGKIRLPDFTGTDLRRAAELLQHGHLKMKPHGSGHAWQQQPPAGSEVAEGASVEIWFK